MFNLKLKLNILTNIKHIPQNHSPPLPLFLCTLCRRHHLPSMLSWRGPHLHRSPPQLITIVTTTNLPTLRGLNCCYRCHKLSPTLNCRHRCRGFHLQLGGSSNPHQPSHSGHRPDRTRHGLDHVFSSASKASTRRTNPRPRPSPQSSLRKSSQLRPRQPGHGT